jgi:hypothetical protein
MLKVLCQHFMEIKRGATGGDTAGLFGVRN